MFKWKFDLAFFAKNLVVVNLVSKLSKMDEVDQKGSFFIYNFL